jgi:hypothetical protein
LNPRINYTIVVKKAVNGPARGVPAWLKKKAAFAKMILAAKLCRQRNKEEKWL